MIRTAIPLGYLFIALFLMCALVAGVTFFFLGKRWGFHRARWAGLGMAGLVVALVIADTAFNAALEWNPADFGDSHAIGKWSDGIQTVTLAADKTYEHKTPSGAVRGTWERDDWNLRLHSDSGTISLMRFIRFGEELRLLAHPPNDPDTWDGDLGLRLD